MGKWAVKFNVEGVVDAETQEEAEEAVRDAIEMMTEVEWDSYSVDDPYECDDDLCAAGDVLGADE